MALKYAPRNDFVLIQIIDRGYVGKVAVPGISKAGKDLVVVAMGPDVKSLNVGDKVMVIGEVGEALAALHDRKDMFVTKQSNVCYVITEEPEVTDVAYQTKLNEEMIGRHSE